MKPRILLAVCLLGFFSQGVLNSLSPKEVAVSRVHQSLFPAPDAQPQGRVVPQDALVAAQKIDAVQADAAQAVAAVKIANVTPYIGRIPQQVVDRLFSGCCGDDFMHLRELGRGKFGVVDLYSYRADPQYQFAVKQVAYNASQLSKVEKERDLYKMLDHENISKLYQFVFSRDKSQSYYFTEHVPGTDLKKFMGAQKRPFTRGEVAKIIWQVAHALRYMHSMGIAHRDIKPENLVMTEDGLVKIIDFGLISDEPFSSDGAGTPYYAAPEIAMIWADPQNRRAYDTKAADWYSLGLTAYYLFTGKHYIKTKSGERSVEFCKRVVQELPQDGFECKDKLVEQMLKHLTKYDFTKRLDHMDRGFNAFTRLPIFVEAGIYKGSVEEVEGKYNDENENVNVGLVDGKGDNGNAENTGFGLGDPSKLIAAITID